MTRTSPADGHFNPGSLLLGVAFIVTWACGSSPDDVTCGDGTRLEGNVCTVPTAGTGTLGRGGSESAGGGGPTQGRAGDEAGNGTELSASGAGQDLSHGGAPQAGAPSFPEGETVSLGGASAEGGVTGQLAAGGAGNDCTPGALDCLCAAERCSGDLVCRGGKCVAKAKAPQSAVPGRYQLPPNALDLVLDAERHRLFASYGGEGVIRALDLDDGEVTIVPTGYYAGQLALDSSRDVVLVTLAVALGSTFDDSEGWVGVVDATTLGDPKRIWVPLDPSYIAGDGRGHAIVSGPSRQQTSIASANIDTGWFQTIVDAAERTSVRAHPDGFRVYGADTRGYPSQLERYDLSETGAVGRPIGGRYYPQALCSDLRIHPSGQTIYTSCGDILFASNDTQVDMTQAGRLRESWSDLAFDESGRYAMAATWQGLLYRYDTTQLQADVPLEPTAELGFEPTLSAAHRIFAGSGYLVLVQRSATTEVEVVPFHE